MYVSTRLYFQFISERSYIKLRITTVDMSQHTHLHVHLLCCFYKDHKNIVKQRLCSTVNCNMNDSTLHRYRTMSWSFALTWHFCSRMPFTTFVSPAYSVSDTKCEPVIQSVPVTEAARLKCNTSNMDQKHKAACEEQDYQRWKFCDTDPIEMTDILVSSLS